MSDPSTLVIKHLPASLTVSENEELFKLFGAKAVRCLPKRRKVKCTAFVTFNNHEDAKQALLKLHQLQICDQRLVVEFAQNQDKHEFPKESDFPTFKINQEESKVSKVSDKEQLRLDSENFSKKLHGSCSILGLDYLPSHVLKYKYPAPNTAIITNISHALFAVPKFYTQVLHLMNKMNLPAPFGPITPMPPILSDEIGDRNIVEEMDTDTEESEIESDTENGKRAIKEIQPANIKQQTKKRRKKLKFHRPSVLVPSKSTDSRTEPADVFESHVQLEATKKIQFNINPVFETEKPAVNIPVDEEVEQTGFGLIETAKPLRDTDSTNALQIDSLLTSGFISLNELKRKRISEREMKTMPVFRNYFPGSPTVRLYIKNLARQVEEKDLRYIFGRFLDWDSETDKNMFDIRLMKEGRMKGQAFVTLASENQAIDAVRETNGFLLHTKPLVVQFARSAKPKENSEKPKQK